MSVSQNIPALSENISAKLLANVFESCLQEPNKTPLSTLISYSESRKSKLLVERIILGLALVVFLIMPFFFIAPQVTIENVADQSAKYPQYLMVETGSVPIASISASVNDNPLSVDEAAEKVYNIYPAENGLMKVKVTLINGQYKVIEIPVDNVDLKAPELISSKLDGDLLYIYVKDEVSGVNYDAVYANTSIGGKLLPESYNEAEGYIVFDTTKANISSFIIPDNRGAILTLNHQEKE